MLNAKKQLTTADRERVSKRIAALETRTDAEVVCAVATESGRYDRAESLCGLIVGVLAVITAQKIAAMDDWDITPALPVGSQVVLIIGGFVVGSLLASYWHGLRHLFVSKKEMATEVDRRVHQVFSQHGVGGTRHRGGLLIYVSLFEHRLEIRCDKAAAEKLTSEDLNGIRDAVLGKVREGQLADGLLAGLDKAEERLAAELPHTGDVTDALANEVLVFHPRP